MLKWWHFFNICLKPPIFVPLNSKKEMEQKKKQERKVVHLQLGDKHYYYGSIAQLFEDFTKEQLGISYYQAKNNLKKAEDFIATEKCIIRRGILRTKPKSV